MLYFAVEDDRLLEYYLNVVERGSEPDWDELARRLHRNRDDVMARSEYVLRSQLKSLQSSGALELSGGHQEEATSQLSHFTPPPTTTATTTTTTTTTTTDDQLDPSNVGALAKQYDFDWIQVGKVLNIDPLEARRIWLSGKDSSPSPSPTLLEDSVSMSALQSAMLRVGLSPSPDETTGSSDGDL